MGSDLRVVPGIIVFAGRSRWGGQRLDGPDGLLWVSRQPRARHRRTQDVVVPGPARKLLNRPQICVKWGTVASWPQVGGESSLKRPPALHRTSCGVYILNGVGADPAL